MAFDLKGAREAGYTDAEIAAYLADTRGFRLDDARNAGYADADIIQHLMGKTALQSDEPIDDRTGAGWKERFAIGSAADNKGKLERARAFYGDSVRMEPDERISFVNPETGRRTYVNPSGFDWGAPR